MSQGSEKKAGIPSAEHRSSQSTEILIDRKSSLSLSNVHSEDVEKVPDDNPMSFNETLSDNRHSAHNENNAKSEDRMISVAEKVEDENISKSLGTNSPQHVVTSILKTQAWLKNVPFPSVDLDTQQQYDPSFIVEPGCSVRGTKTHRAYDYHSVLFGNEDGATLKEGGSARPPSGGSDYVPHPLPIPKMGPIQVDTVNVPSAAGPIRSGKKVANEEEKKHVCPVCSKGFLRPSALMVHNRTHTKERPFLCPDSTCERASAANAFSVKSNWTRHIRQCHPELVQLPPVTRTPTIQLRYRSSVKRKAERTLGLGRLRVEMRIGEPDGLCMIVWAWCV